MKKSICTKCFFCCFKQKQSLGYPDFGTPVIRLLTGPARPGQVPEHAGACRRGMPGLATITNAKSQCKKDNSEQELGKLCSKEAEGAGCECQGTLGFYRY